jgi:uncharacterized membrane protein YdjX (TVP38/TMEM64 family)
MKKRIKKINSENAKKIAFLILIILAAFIFFQVVGFHKTFIILKNYIENVGFLGLLIFCFIFAISGLIAVPMYFMTVIAGTLFGITKGIIISSIGSLIGAVLAFWIARYFAKNFIRRLFSKSKKFKKLNFIAMTKGNIIVAVMRLIPFPAFILNYGFGLTKIPFKTYLFWSWLCMLPEIVILILGTDTIMKIFLAKQIPWLTATIFVSLSIILFFVVKKIKQKIT